jgi:hypothetical protein
MASVYHIVAIHVNKTSWAHICRLHFCYLGTGYDSGPEYRGDISGPLPGSSFEPGKGILALLGEH